LIQKDKTNKRIKDILSIAKNRKIKVNFLEKSFFQKKFKDKTHQGIVAIISKFSYYNLNDFFQSKFILILDSITDQHNFGSIVRSADFFGVEAIVISKDRSVSVNDTTVKTSSGSIFNIPIVKETNLTTTIEKLKKNGFFIVATSPNAAESIDNLPKLEKKVLIIGNEEKGIRKKILEHSDFNVALKNLGKTTSLNAAVSAAIFIYELTKERVK